ncbi:MAG TPA: hypothetical protein VEC38_10030 [Candidatus Binataceae bacterium]|nr:hypothetical protein [Candidatus Binataceae bacterium]
MKGIIALAALAAIGCSVQQPAMAPEAAPAPVRALAFRGRLVAGDRDALPPAVALSLADKSRVTFSYREELSHDEHHVPLWYSALDPVTYAGVPLGDFGVSAFAMLSVFVGEQAIGDYTAQAYVSKSYSLYSEPTHSELEQSARAKVRDEIDRKLYRDEERLTRAISASDAAADRAIK